MLFEFRDELEDGLIELAFPFTYQFGRAGKETEFGLQKWEWYLGKAMQGLAANPALIEHPKEFLVELAMDIVRAINKQVYEQKEQKEQKE